MQLERLDSDTITTASSRFSSFLKSEHAWTSVYKAE